MKKRSSTTRREFLKRGAVTVASGVSAPYLVPNSVLGASGRAGANDRVNIGVIGTGSRARMLMNQLPDTETFPGDEEANGLLDRPRCKGFELPT